MYRNICVLLSSVAVGCSAFAASSLPAPDIMVVADKDYGGSLEHLSDNGLWAVGYGKSIITETAYSFPRLYDLTSKKVTYLFTPGDAESVAVMTANDVCDDGSIVVGSYDDRPAIWRAATGKWETVENNHQFKSGVIERITPDGRLAIGTVRYGSGMFASLRVWDLSGETPKDITPDNLPKPIGPNISPTKGELDSMVQQLYAGDISSDGAFFTGMVNFSYPDDCWTFVYDLVNKSWKGIAMQVTDMGDTYTFERSVDGVFYANTGDFVGTSHVLSGEYYSTSDDSGIFFYDCDTASMSLMEGTEGYQSPTADSLGTVYASRSYEGPMRDWYFKSGDYWYDFAVLARQLWNLDWEQQISQDGVGLTGTVTCVSDDGLTVLASDYSANPYASYLIKLPAPFPEIVKDFNLLGNYYTTPVDNSSFAFLREVKVTFDRNVEVVGEYSSVSLLDADGNVVANSISLIRDAGDSKSISAIFRNRRLEEGKNYTVVFPAGVISIEGDAAQTNGEIRVSYKGRPDAPVAPVAIAPADGSEVARINANSNPVMIRFNSDIAPVDGNNSPVALFLVGEDGSRESVATFSGSVTGDVLSVYPVLEQRLAYGSHYEVVVPAGTVADLSGADPNEEIVISYAGSYLPEGPGLDGVLFEDDFDQGLTNKWMFYDGASDLEPSDLMASWGFTQGMPWWTVMDSESSTSQSAASHSMFKSPGKADSWMVTSILNISDESAYLAFKSQNYQDVGDMLKVYAYATDNIYTSLTTSIIDNFRYYGDLIYEEAQEPGANEELLEGEWRDNLISLEKYAGKNIYIAFVNDNRNKSAIFLDDVKIAIDMKYAVVNTTPSSVVDKDEVEISASVQVLGENESYKGYSIRLNDAGGNLVSSLSDPDAVAEQGWRLDFKFPDMLPVKVGKANKFSINVTLGDEEQSLSASVLDLAMETSKKVVLEEYTGQGCQFCPLGHAALDWIQKDFPGLVLPVELHSYPADNFNNEQVQAMTDNLGMQAAPTARINRGADIVAPMSQDEDHNYIYKNAGLWYDHVVAELENMAPADVEVTSVVFDGNDCVADVTVTYALDLENANVNMLLELCEDDLMGFQTNGVHHDQAVLGDWGANGIYNRDTNLYYYHNVLRNWAGNTYNGTGGLLPTTIEAGVPYTVKMKVAAPKSIVDINKTHVTAMLIDSESGKILNADRRFTNTDTGVGSVDSALYSLAVIDGNISVAYPGTLDVEVYSLDGMRIASVSGSDSVSVDVEAGTPIALVVVRTADGTRHHKVRLR